MAHLALVPSPEESPVGQTRRARDSACALSLSYGHNSFFADKGPVLLSISPEAGRCVIVYAPEESAEAVRPYVVDEETGEILVDPEREAYLALENRRRSLRRSRSRLQDYVVANRLSKMWTLTVGGQGWGRDRDLFKAEVQKFMRRWHKLEGKAFPYAYVLELQARGVWHAHILVPGDFYTDFYALSSMWGYGRVRFDKQRSAHDGSRRALRRAAAYLCKYMSKDWENGLGAGQHRYEVAEGFQPARASMRFHDWRDAREFLGRLGGYHLAFASADEFFWTGPPVEVFYNDDDVGAQAA